MSKVKIMQMLPLWASFPAATLQSHLTAPLTAGQVPSATSPNSQSDRQPTAHLQGSLNLTLIAGLAQTLLLLGKVVSG